MARSIRLEYCGAYYHVMARGNRCEAILPDDDDRRFFLQPLSEACERTGWRVHTLVLMGNQGVYINRQRTFHRNLPGISVMRQPRGDIDGGSVQMSPVVLPAADVAKVAEQAKVAKPVVAEEKKEEGTSKDS